MFRAATQAWLPRQTAGIAAGKAFDLTADSAIGIRTVTRRNRTEQVRTMTKAGVSNPVISLIFRGKPP